MQTIIISTALGIVLFYACILRFMEVKESGKD